MSNRLLIFAVLFFVVSCGGQKVAEVYLKNNVFYVEIADTPESRAKGLMGRKNLPDDRGMLFVFEEPGIYSFWMKNTLVPLDIIWLNEDKKVVYISKNNHPPKRGDFPIIKPRVTAKYVLEISGGMSEKIGLNVGDVAAFDLLQRN